MKRFLVPVLLVGAGFGAACLVLPAASPAPAGPIPTSLWTLDRTEAKSFDWGEARLIHTAAETYGVKDCLVGHVTLKPGQTNHPPHRHGEEEFLVLVEGEGTWHLNGKDHPARKGDVVYTAPWDPHGITNTGTKPLTFFVVKWGYKGVPSPPPPAEAK